MAITGLKSIANIDKDKPTVTVITVSTKTKAGLGKIRYRRNSPIGNGVKRFSIGCSKIYPPVTVGIITDYSPAGSGLLQSYHITSPIRNGKDTRSIGTRHWDDNLPAGVEIFVVAN